MKFTACSNHALRSLELPALKAPDRVKVEDSVLVQGLARPRIVKIVHELGRALQAAALAFLAALYDLTVADIASNAGELPARIAPIGEGIVAPKRRTQ